MDDYDPLAPSSPCVLVPRDFAHSILGPLPCELLSSRDLLISCHLSPQMDATNLSPLRVLTPHDFEHPILGLSLGEPPSSRDHQSLTPVLPGWMALIFSPLHHSRLGAPNTWVFNLRAPSSRDHRSLTPVLPGWTTHGLS
jgi:hypothetical protein